VAKARVVRSHDLVLRSRVEGYRPTHLDIYPMAELPRGAAGG
jgi:uncharacterized protein YcaQ